MSGRYLGRKFAQALVTIAAIVILMFLMFRMMPGSPDRALGRNPHLTPDVIAAARARWGLDKPVVPDQLVAYGASMPAGDLGYSIFYQGQPVTEVVGQSVGPTILLVGLGEVVAII